MAPADAVPDGLGNGLTGDEARRRLKEYGANAMPDTTARPWRRALSKFWAPVPWMLEAAILLQIALGDDAAAGIIAGLLLFNATLGLFQEARAQDTLAASSSLDVLIASVLAVGGIAMAPVPAFAFVVDAVKVPVFARLRIA